MNRQVFVGIDPGLQGGIAVIYPNKVDVIPMPLAGKEVDVDCIMGFLPYMANDEMIYACIERVSSRPGQGVASMFKFGFVTGVVHGILRCRKIPLEMVAPQTWKKEILNGTDKSKDAAADWCRRVYPQVNLLATPRSTKYHSGIADSLCLAEYCRRKFK